MSAIRAANLVGRTLAHYRILEKLGAVCDFKLAEARLDYVVGSRVLERSVAGSCYVPP